MATKLRERKIEDYLYDEGTRGRVRQDELLAFIDDELRGVDTHRPGALKFFKILCLINDRDHGGSFEEVVDEAIEILEIFAHAFKKHKGA